MRILVLIHEFPPVGGGGGRAAEDVCRELAKRGHEIKVLTTHLKGLPHEETRDGFYIIRLGSLRVEAYRASLHSMMIYVLVSLWTGYRLIKRWRPDLIHVHFAVPAGALAWALSCLTGTPYVLTTHLGDVPGGVPEKTSFWFRLVYPFTHLIWRRAKQVVAVSRFTRQLAEKHYSVPIEVVPNGADLTMLVGDNIRLQSPPRIVFAGRFMPQKNPVQIVETLASLKDLKWECVMLGDGPLLESVKRTISDHELEGRFTLPGWVTPQDVIGWFGKSDLLFMPSLSEGLPVVGIQALLNGLAIVASRVGGFVDLVEQGENGFLFPPQDMDGMREALRTLLTDRAALLHARSRSREQARRFDLALVADAYETFFQEAVYPK